MATPRRMFDRAALDRVISMALDTSLVIPEDARGAFVTVANQIGVKAVIALKVNDAWRVEAVVAHEWKRPPGASTYGVKVTGTF